jgi:Zn-dependent protease with chaperone function
MCAMYTAAAVQFDTLLKQVEQEELVAILGHELGHWKLSHTLRNFAVTQVYLFLALAGKQRTVSIRATVCIVATLQ